MVVHLIVIKTESNKNAFDAENGSSLSSFHGLLYIPVAYLKFPNATAIQNIPFKFSLHILKFLILADL